MGKETTPFPDHPRKMLEKSGEHFYSSISLLSKTTGICLHPGRMYIIFQTSIALVCFRRDVQGNDVILGFRCIIISTPIIRDKN